MALVEYSPQVLEPKPHFVQSWLPWLRWVPSSAQQLEQSEEVWPWWSILLKSWSQNHTLCNPGYLGFVGSHPVPNNLSKARRYGPGGVFSSSLGAKTTLC